MLKAIGDWGFVFAGSGVVVFTLLFLLSVRWWSDHLGRAIAAVTGLTSLIAALGIARFVDTPVPGGIDMWRAVIYPLLGASLWASIILFAWVQFIRPIVRGK